MAKIAYGNKENIQDAIDGNVIPYDALVLTSDGNDAEMFFYDKDGNLKNIVNKTKFTSLDEAQEWILKYPCVGQNFTIYNGTGWGSYIVTSENILNPIATNTDIKNLTETKADKATTYTATETDDMLSTKADKSDLDSINSIINKNFELIATQTVSPDTDGSLPNAIEFSVNNELTDFYLYANVKLTATSAVRLHTNDMSLWGNAPISGLYNANSTFYRHWYIQYISFGENKGGIISAPSQAIANSSGIVRPPQGNLYNDYSVIVPHTSVHDKVRAINNIKKIKLSLVNDANNPAFAEGSTFELWGVKKK